MCPWWLISIQLLIPGVSLLTEGRGFCKQIHGEIGWSYTCMQSLFELWLSNSHGLLQMLKCSSTWSRLKGIGRCIYPAWEERPVTPPHVAPGHPEVQRDDTHLARDSSGIWDQAHFKKQDSTLQFMASQIPWCQLATRVVIWLDGRQHRWHLHGDKRHLLASGGLFKCTNIFQGDGLPWKYGWGEAFLKGEKCGWGEVFSSFSPSPARTPLFSQMFSLIHVTLDFWVHIILHLSFQMAFFSSFSLATTISGKSIHWNGALLIHLISN